MQKKLLFIAALCCALNAYSSADESKKESVIASETLNVEVIIVNKIPRGAYAEGNDWANEVSPEFRHIGWYEIGLSRNGEEPIEYIWRAGEGPSHYTIMMAGIGDRGTIHLRDWAKRCEIKLPQPNATNPPVIGLFGEVYWEKTKMDVQNKQWNLMLDGKKYIILRPYILRDIETGEIIDLRTTDRIKPGSGGEFRKEIN